MSAENVEVVREAMALIRHAGADAPQPRLLDLLAPNMTLDMSRRRFNPDVYEGYEGLRRFKRERDEIWEEFRVTPERFIDAGEKVVVVESLRGRGRGSGLQTTSHSTSVWTISAGRVAHMATYYDKGEALKAAGLEDIGLEE